jgi:hypothetical protein
MRCCNCDYSSRPACYGVLAVGLSCVVEVSQAWRDAVPGERVILIEERLARLEARMATLIEAPQWHTLCYCVTVATSLRKRQERFWIGQAVS